MNNQANKNHVCPQCGKKFSTQRGLQQHEEMVHKNGQKSSGKGRKRNNRRRRNAGNPPNAGWDPAPSRIKSPPGSTITVQGEDRLASFSIGKDKDMSMSFMIDANVSTRLNALSTAYQRIKWDKIRVTVTPQASATTNGGYVCGMVMDPSDDHQTAVDLSSTEGSQTKKFYETAIVTPKPVKTLLFTSAGEDPRLSSPGRFWIISEGQPSSDLNIIVTLEWAVTLSQPTVERKSEGSFVCSKNIYPLKDNYCLRWADCGKEGDDDFSVDFSSLVPARCREEKGNHYFRVPSFIIEYSEGTGDTGSIQMNYMFYRQSDKKMYYSTNGSSGNDTKWQANLDDKRVVAPFGTFFRYMGTGNACAGVAVRRPPSLTSSTSVKQLLHSEELESRLRTMETLLSRFSHLSRPGSRRLSETSLTSEFESLTKPTE